VVYEIRICKDADREHESSNRQYAHCFHKDGIICVARAFYSLPQRYIYGILLHEVGHILAGRGGGEQAANLAAYKYSGVRVRYRARSRYGDQLEYVEPADIPIVKEILK
jgi:hypothetical protein